MADVNNIAVTGIDIQPKVQYTTVGKTVRFYASITPNNATNKNVSWSISDNSIVRNEGDGVFTALSDGEVTISAVSEDGSHRAQGRIVVVADSDIHVSGISFYDENGHGGHKKAVLGNGEQFTLVARVLDNYGVDYKGVTWSTSDQSIATVSSGGNFGSTGWWVGNIVAGGTNGTATITATSVANPSISATFTIIVQSNVKHVNGISVSPASKTVKVGSTFSLSAILSPSDASNNTVLWSVSVGSPFYAVDKNNGIFKAIRVGTGRAFVEAEDGGFEANCFVTVTNSDSGGGDEPEPIPTEDKILYVSISESSFVCSHDEEFTLVGRAIKSRPEGAPSEMTGTVSFETSDPSVVSIVRTYYDTYPALNAFLKAGTKDGTATITVTSTDDPTKKATCIVTVSSDSGGDEPAKENPVRRVNLNTDYLELEAGENRSLYVTVIGKDGTSKYVNRTVTWNSSNNDVVTIDEYGLITAIAEGTCYVTVTSVEDSDIHDDCTVVVKKSSGSDTDDGTDYIIRIDYNDDGSFEQTKLFEGNLGFKTDCPIESVVSFETDDIQKIYWVDGIHVLRFMNFMDKKMIAQNWNDDPTYFDSNRAISFGIKSSITKDNSGNTRQNGTVQYFVTYFTKHGQESGIVWASDLVYLSPIGHGGGADETNNNRVTVTLSNLDVNKYSHIRLYSVVRSSLDGTPVSYLVAEQPVKESVSIVDDGAHLTLLDSSSLLYLGSQNVLAGTIEHKDNTLFLGDLISVGRDYSELEYIIRTTMFDLDKTGGKFVDGETYKCKKDCIKFQYSDNAIDDIHDIPYVRNEGTYPYSNQLSYSSSEILSFKGGEKYRFALKFKLQDGTETDAFWIGDAENDLYPVVDVRNRRIKRIVAVCTLSDGLINFLQTDKKLNIRAVSLAIAEATDADRSVKAQGILNPTMFNTWERYNNRLYSIPSWISRPRGAKIASSHFAPVAKSTSSFGEIQCNYWQADTDKAPYYQYEGYLTNPRYTEEWEGVVDFQHIMIIYEVRFYLNNPLLYAGDVVGALITNFYSYKVNVTIITAKSIDPEQIPAVNMAFHEADFAAWSDSSKEGWKTLSLHGTDISDDEDATPDEVLRYEYTYLSPKAGTALWDHGTARQTAYNNMRESLINSGIPDTYIVDFEHFKEWCIKSKENSAYYFNDAIYGYTDVIPTYGESKDMEEILNAKTGDRRWLAKEDYDLQAVHLDGEKEPSYQKKHLMFVDENVLTFDSPEILYVTNVSDEAEYKFRIVGVSKVTADSSDYTIDVSNSSISGSMVDIEQFSGNANSRKLIDGFTAWPLLREYDLVLNEEGKKRTIAEDVDRPALNRISDDYSLSKRVVRYWIYLWQKRGGVSGYRGNKENGEEEYSVINNKIIANRHFSYNTIYLADAKSINANDIRIVDGSASNMYSLDIGLDSRYYSGSVQTALSMPNALRYPIGLSTVKPDSTDEKVVFNEKNARLYSTEPILLDYHSNRHAVISLPSRMDGQYYVQTILPAFFDNEVKQYENLRQDATDVKKETTGALIPWINGKSGRAAYYAPKSTCPIFVVDNFDDTNNKISLHAYGDNTGGRTAFSMWVSDVQFAISSISDDVYCRLVTENAAYLVRMNGNEYNQVEVDGVQKSIFALHNADVISYVLFNGDNIVTVGVTYYEKSNARSSSSVIKYGYKTLTMNDGSLTTPEYPYVDYRVEQSRINFMRNSNLAERLTSDDRYFFIGELYTQFDEKNDTRYGGITLSKVQSNRFITAGPLYSIDDVIANQNTIYGNQGDTYFQRWDDLRITPSDKETNNGIIDIVSVMLETHINLDGRTDKMREQNELSSIDTAQFGQINPVYSQQNNYIVRRDLDEDFNTDSYRSSITWTLPKADLANIDEWSHITLASSLKLDGDKGICRALRRFQNNLIAFQDRGIAEVLFNSRVQLSTEEGVPVEIGNSGKVDGKRYLSNKYGCINKWSIVEGKSGLYFVDNINKSFCVTNYATHGKLSVDNLSAKNAFSAWFKKNNSIQPWTSKNFENIVSFYDRIHSDVYLVKKSDDENQSCLVYSEVLDSFTSFFDYAGVPMMVNVGDKFVSFKNNKLWLQNEGLYCNFFGTQYPFWTTYRVSPNPVTDKIWTNLDFQSDFYRVLDESGDSLFEINTDISDFDEMDYRENETFDEVRIWNEYQDTGNFAHRPEKKFRTWRYSIPRAKSNDMNIYGLDRIRNPWINLTLKKTPHMDENQDLMQLHDVVVKYFE